MNSISSIHAPSIARQRTAEAAAAARSYTRRHAEPVRTMPAPRRSFRVHRAQPAGV